MNFGRGQDDLMERGEIPELSLARADSNHGSLEKATTTQSLADIVIENGKLSSRLSFFKALTDLYRIWLSWGIMVEKYFPVSKA